MTVLLRPLLLVGCVILGAVNCADDDLSVTPVNADIFKKAMQDIDKQMVATLTNDDVEKAAVEKRLEEIDEEKTKTVSTDGTPIENDFDTWEGPYAKEFFQGDILLTEDQLNAFGIPTANNRTRRQAQKTSRYPANLWKGMAIPYSFGPKFPSERIAPIRQAIKFWEDNTCIRFREGAAGTARLKFISDGGCYSYVGKTGWEQPVSIGYGCDWIGTIAHELAHAFGIWHVQSRWDRDTYVHVNAWNIPTNQMHNFVIHRRDQTDLYGLPYEFGSNMHYFENDFGKDRSKPTLVAKTGYQRFQNSMANPLPTNYDVHLVNSYYGCYDSCRTRINCQNGGRQDVNNCAKCRCPAGFAGTYCENISTKGCDKYYAVGSQYQTITMAAGWGGKRGINYNFCNIHLKSQTAGNYSITCHSRADKSPFRRIEVTVTSKQGFSSWNCFGAGVELRVSRDPALAGIRMCRPNTSFAPVASDGDRMVLSLYSRINYVDFTFKIRAI